jgi:predicted ATPase
VYKRQQYVLEFATEFRLAKDKIKSIDILNVNYKFENEEDRIYINKEKYLSLKSASSGIQTLLPIYLTIEYLNLTSKKHYILEEPELNIFPEEQFELVKYMIKNSESVIFITHSPYVLFSLNILLYAYEVGNMNKEAKKLVEEIVPSDYWINPEEFSAYYFENGKIKNFFDSSIEDNVLDGVSTELEDIFDELQDIYIKVKK